MGDGNPRLRGALLVAAAASLWGGWALFLRPAGLSPIAASVVVMVTMALPAPWAFSRRAFADRGAAWALVAIGVADAANVGLYFSALARGPIAVAVLTHYLAPVLLALLAPALGIEARSRRALIAAPLSLVGLALLVWQPGGAIAGVTALLGAGSAAFYVVIVLAAKRATASFAPIAITALHTPLSAALLLALFGRAALPHAMGWPVLLVAAGGLVCGVSASVLFYRGLARIPAQMAGALTYLEPVSAAVLGAVAFGERIGLRGAVGAVILVAGGVFVALEQRGGPAVDGAPAGAAP